MEEKDEEEEDNYRSGKSKKKDYTAPINFVSGGLKEENAQSKQTTQSNQRPSMASFNANRKIVENCFYLVFNFCLFQRIYGR